jgi:hypothetical protein
MTRRIAAALAALTVTLLAGCATADPLPEGSSDFSTGSSPTATTVPPSPATAEPDREACKEAIKDEALAGTLDAANIPAPCEGLGPDELATISDEALAELEELEALVDPEPEPAAPGSTCDVAREAFLTGTEAEIEAALAALVADTTADATAREAAQSYLEEDDPTLRGLHKDFVQYACGLDR